MIRKKGIFLQEGDEFAGPFCSREDAERFLTLMDLVGGGRQGIEIVERYFSIYPASPPRRQDSKSKIVR